MIAVRYSETKCQTKQSVNHPDATIDTTSGLGFNAGAQTRVLDIGTSKTTAVAGDRIPSMRPGVDEKSD